MSGAPHAAEQFARELEAAEGQQRERDSDIAHQLRQIGTSLATERRLADDRFETLRKMLDEVDKKLAVLVRQNTTNGSGHAP